MKFKKGSIRRSLRYSILDGVFYCMMVGVTESYLAPYAIALGASASQVAFLVAVPALIASIIQMESARVTQSVGSRTKLINFLVFFHAILWIPILLVPYMLRGQSWAGAAIWVLIGFVALHASVGVFPTPAWQSLMSDYIPPKKRGQFFGWKNRLQGFVVVGFSIGAGLLLHYFGKERLVGFAILFAFAVAARLLSWWCLRQMVEPFRKTTHDEYFSFVDFLRQMHRSNFAKFVLWVSLMAFSVNLSAPLLSVFMLRDLHFSYLQYMVVVTVASLSSFLFQPFWGRIADRYGNVRVLRMAGWGVAIVPCLWIFSHDLRYLAVVQLVAGACWGGSALAMANFPMEAVSPGKRIRCISYMTVMQSFAVFLGAAVGGQLIGRVPPLFGYSFLTLFLISCVGRVIVMTVMSTRIKEIRSV